MPKVRSGSGQKWSRNASQATETYTEGVRNPRTPWSQATQNAAESYKAGIQQSITEGRFAKGVAKAGDQKWQTNAVQKGGERFASGVQQGVTSYETGVAPYLSVIESTTLPPRYATGDPRNLERVKAIAMALRNKKTKG